MPTSKKAPKKVSKVVKKHVWFTKVRGSYLPASTEGWLTYLPFTAYLLLSLYIGLNNTDTYGLGLLYVVPNWVAAAVILTWVAQSKS